MANQRPLFVTSKRHSGKREEKKRKRKKQKVFLPRIGENTFPLDYDDK